MNGVKVVEENQSRELHGSQQSTQVSRAESASQLVEELLANSLQKSGEITPSVKAGAPDVTPGKTVATPAAPQVITVTEQVIDAQVSATMSSIPEQSPPRISVSEIRERENSNPTLPPINQAEGRRSSNRQQVGTIPVILFDSVSKSYPAQPNKPALNNVSLSINAGEFIFLVGHSGSGKSTFIRLINREIVATRGRLAVAGEDVIRMRRWRVPYLRRNIGCVFQDFKLLPNKTAFGNVAFALEVIGKSKHIIRTQVPEVLRLVGLEDKLDKYPDQLSGGEQQRVSIARAIVNRPPLLICDEPTGNLDPQTSLGIMRLLDRINRTGTTVLVATHDREMVDSLRKRVIELENGYLVRDQDRGVYGEDA